MWRASLQQLRIYLWIILSILAIHITASLIVAQFVADKDSTQISHANILTIFLICMAVALPVGFFKRAIHLGASRKEYFAGALAIYTVWAAVFALFNIMWLKVERVVFIHYFGTFNILEIFGWDRFGIAGMFVYQFGAYMLLISVLNLLFSGLKHVVGWIVWVVLIAAIPIGTGVPVLRPKVADALLTLLFNDSLLQGFGLTFLLSCVFLAGGWWLTMRRTF